MLLRFTNSKTHGFSDFHGNAETVRRLREMLARKHFPHAVILSGGAGGGEVYAGSDADAGFELPGAY